MKLRGGPNESMVWYATLLNVLASHFVMLVSFFERKCFVITLFVFLLIVDVI